MNKASFRFEYLLRIIGLLVLGIYLISLIATLPSTIQIVGFLLLSPIVILTILSIHEKYPPETDYVSSQRFAVVFFIIAFAIANLMIAVQQASLHYYNQVDDQTADVKSYFSLFNSIQLGMDVSFDIFYSVGIFLFSLRFLTQKGIGYGLGLFGIVISISLLAFNLAVFPVPPKDAGLIDLGPLTIAWWLLLVIVLKQQRRNA